MTNNYMDIKRKKKSIGKAVSVLIKEKEKILRQVDSLERTISYLKEKLS